ncbi:MAG: TolC family protein [Treponema sp.]|jgi:outer membrane protein TolC|nr:TolC family protein [Treponema sp.]
MLPRVCFLIVLCCLFLWPPLYAHADQIVLSLADALERGIENNLSLKKSLIDLEAAGYSANRLWSEVFPTISGSLGGSYSSALFSGDGLKADKNNFNASASLGINLTLNAGIPYSMKNISLLYQSRLLSYEDARNQLGIQITKNFYSLIADRDNLAVLADMLNLAQLQHERNQVAFKNGLVGELTLMQSQLSMENSRYSLSAAKSAYATRLGDFLAQLGIPPDAGTAPVAQAAPQAMLEGKIEIVKIEVDAERLIQENLSRRPDIVSRRQEIERLENAHKQSALSNKAPSIRLEAGWNSRSFDPFADTLSGSATLNIPIDPWIPGTSRNQSVLSAKYAVDKARLDLQSAEDAAKAQIRSLAANLRNSWDSIEIARLSMSVAERGHELTQQGFRNGTVDSLKLEDARNNLAAARQRLLQAELAYFNMILDISAALNINWKDLMK